MKTLPVTAPVLPWGLPPQTMTLADDEVHVWRAVLDQPPSQVQSFLHTLDAEEQARAKRFRFEQDRQHFIAARGVLRDILGGYLNRAPASLAFCASPQGKPALTVEPDRPAIRFNLSHSQGTALYAIARGREVGIDLERIRSDLAIDEIAERFFSRREVAMLRRLPADVRCQAFFLCWTRKEAYLKARGDGLSLSLDQFDVSLVPGEPAALLGTRHDPADVSRWSIQELAPAPGYAAALAVEGRGYRLACWQWPGPRPQSS